MSAPSATPLGTPAGKAIEDGFASLIVFSLNPSIALFEKETQPSAIDGQDAIDITTMRNKKVRTKAARSLKDIGEISITCGYDPRQLQAIYDLVNNDAGSITQYWPDESNMAAWAYLQKAEPQSLKEGEMPEINVTIVVTNRDPADGSEAEPVYSPGP